MITYVIQPAKRHPELLLGATRIAPTASTLEAAVRAPPTINTHPHPGYDLRPIAPYIDALSNPANRRPCASSPFRSRPRFLRSVIAALVDGRLVDGFEARSDPARLAAATL